MDAGWTVLEGTPLRPKFLLKNGLLERWGPQLARILLTTEELKVAIRMRYESDELTAIRLLRFQESAFCATYIFLGLPRHVIREALSALACSRAQQVASRGTLCATRFKFSEDGGPLPTTRVKCGAKDS